MIPPSVAVKEQSVVPPRQENYSFVEVFFYALGISTQQANRFISP